MLTEAPRTRNDVVLVCTCDRSRVSNVNCVRLNGSFTYTLIDTLLLNSCCLAPSELYTPPLMRPCGRIRGGRIRMLGCMDRLGLTRRLPFTFPDTSHVAPDQDASRLPASRMSRTSV